MPSENPAENPVGNEVRLELSPETAQGKYANFAVISHSPNEFVFDFAAAYPSQPSALVVSRVVTNPRHAKAFLRALEENLRRYEANFGTIEEAVVQISSSTQTN